MTVLVAQAPLRARAAGDITLVEVKGATPRREEINTTITLDVDGLSGEQLGQCLARGRRRVRRGADPSAIFGRVHWTAEEERILSTCSASKCLYEFPQSMKVRIAAASGLANKKRVYYQLLYELATAANKKRKRYRIEHYQVKGEPCAKLPEFHWLINGPVKTHDVLEWRKVSASKRMRPTVLLTQLFAWKNGNTRCVGRTLLFSDHYYTDSLELYQSWPQNGHLRVRYHQIHRFDFFNSWLARRFKGTIAGKLRQHALTRLVKRVKRCQTRFAGK
ncbi:MAG: hypothetical protein KC503_05165 [Myxococcales bacterium]|nr:hypothetical protein [Myxococcales bacterium]